MKRLFYIFHDKLGENLFATPCLELLSKDYEIFVLMKEWMIPFFKNYNFIHKIIPIEKIENYSSLFEEKLSWYAYHNDKQDKILKCKFKNVVNYGVIHDQELNLLSGSNLCNEFLSRTRHYMLKLNLMTLEQISDFDCSIRVPNHIRYSKEKSIVIYQGSRETVRSLSWNCILEFHKKLPNAIFLIKEECVKYADEKNMKYIVMDPITEERYSQIIELFSKGAKCMIGPDSALTHLALGYRIPQIWLQTRIKIQQVVDPQLIHLCHVYKKYNLSCDKRCVGCSNIMSVDFGVYKIEGEVNRHEKLQCVINQNFSCIDYTQEDIDTIYNLAIQEKSS